MKKKWIAFCLVLCMIMGELFYAPMHIFAQSENDLDKGYTYLFEENYNHTSAAVNLGSSGFTYIQRPENGEEADRTPVGEDLGVDRVLMSGMKNNPSAITSFGTDLAGKIVLEGEFRVEGRPIPQGYTSAGVIKFFDIFGATNASSNTSLFCLSTGSIGDDGFRLRPLYGNGTGNVTQSILVNGAVLSYQRWHTLKVILDTEENRITVYVNGVKIVEDMYFWGNPEEVTAIKEVRSSHANGVQIDAANPDNAHVNPFMLDNVRVYAFVEGEEPEPDPDPDPEVDIDDMIAYMSHSVVIRKDTDKAYSTNTPKNTEGVPFEQNGKLYAPVGDIVKGFYSDTGLDIPTGTQYIHWHGTEIKMFEGETYVLKNKEACTIGAAPILQDGVMYATLEDVAKVLDIEAFYDPTTGIGMISREGHLMPEANRDEWLGQIVNWYEEEVRPSAELYVSPNGGNGGDGSIGAPFATLENAQAKVRQLLQGGQTGDIVVYLRGGTYYLEQALRFTKADSHTGNYTVTYKAYPGEKPLIDGGKRITDWAYYGDGIYRADIGVGVNPLTLYEDGSRVTIARYPNEGYNRVIMAEETPKQKFLFHEGDIPVVANPTELMLYIWPGGPAGHYNWSMARPRVAALDYAQRTVMLDREVIYELGTGSRYFAYNALEFLDTPGEYYVDQGEGKIYYIPKAENIEDAVIVAPANFDLISIGGTNTELAANIVLDGLEIRSTDMNKSNIMITNARNIVIQNCQIYNSGHVGVYMRGNVQNSTVESSHIYQTGFYGVFLEGFSGTTEMNHYGNQVVNSHVHHVGELNGNAAGIRFKDTAYCYGAYNKVNDSPRNGLHLLGAPDQNLVGNTIQGVLVTEANVRDFKLSEYNTLEYNDVSQCMQDSQDTNAIGAWGIDYYNVLRKNVVHDNVLPHITAKEGDSFWYPYYFDENSNGSYVLSNLSYDNQLAPGGYMNAAFHNNASKDTQIKNNIFADTTYRRGVLSISDMNSTNRRSMNILAENNLFTGFKDTIYYLASWNQSVVNNMNDNLFLSTEGIYLLGGRAPTATLDAWRKQENGAFDTRSIIADPMYVSPEKRDFRLQYGSPAYIIGFEDINQSDIGLRSDYPFADQADEIDKIYAFREGDYSKKAWMHLESAETAKLKVAVRTVNGYLLTEEDLTTSFYSADPTIATIDQEGNIQALQKGKVIMTATATKNNKSITTEFEVVVEDHTLVGLAIMGIPGSLQVGDVITPQVFTVTEFGRLTPTEEVELSSDREDAVVSNNGTILLNGSGTVTITAVSTEDPELVGTLTIEVSAADFSNVALRMDKELYTVGDPVQVQYVLKDTNGQEMDGSEAQITIQGDGEIIVVADGTISAAKMGIGELKAIVELEGITVVSSAHIAVVDHVYAVPMDLQLLHFTPMGRTSTVGYAYGENDRIHMATSGNDVWNAEDASSFLGKEVDGEQKVTVTATLHEVTNPQSYATTGAKAIHAAAGVMLRAGSEAGSQNVFVRYRLNGDVIMTYRNQEFPASANIRGGVPGKPIQVKVEKEGTQIRGYYKDEAGIWQLIGEVTCQMSGSIYAGIGLQSGVLGDWNTAQFSDVAIVEE